MEMEPSVTKAVDLTAMDSDKRTGIAVCLSQSDARAPCLLVAILRRWYILPPCMHPTPLRSLFRTVGIPMAARQMGHAASFSPAALPTICC